MTTSRFGLAVSFSDRRDLRGASSSLGSLCTSWLWGVRLCWTPVHTTHLGKAIVEKAHPTRICFADWDSPPTVVAEGMCAAVICMCHFPCAGAYSTLGQHTIRLLPRIFFCHVCLCFLSVPTFPTSMMTRIA